MKTFLLMLLLPAAALANEEGMREMPKISPSRSYVVGTKAQGEELLEGRGFGANAPAVGMKNLMMVGGSGYEGMEMGKAPPAAPAHHHMGQAAEAGAKLETSPSPVRAGVTAITVALTDANGSPRTGLKPKAQVSMATMDMGTQSPRVRETSPGRYELKASFTMKGPWNVKLELPEGEKTFTVDVQ